jgi:hypothetical protein
MDVLAERAEAITHDKFAAARKVFELFNQVCSLLKGLF